MSDLQKNVTCFSAFDVCADVCGVRANFYRNYSQAKRKIKNKFLMDRCVRSYCILYIYYYFCIL